MVEGGRFPLMAGDGIDCEIGRDGPKYMRGRKWGIYDKDSLAGKCNLGCYFIFFLFLIC